MAGLLPATLAWADVSHAFVASTGLNLKLDGIWNLFVSSTRAFLVEARPIARLITLPPSLFAPADAVAEQVAALAGMAGKADTIKFVLVLLLGYLFAALFAGLGSGKSAPVFVKHLLSATVGILMAQWVFGSDWAAPLLSAAVTYVILLLAAAVPVIGAYRHMIVMVWMMGFMTVCHLWRLETDYLGWTMDFTGPQMVLTIKLTSLAFNLADGARRAKYNADIATQKARQAELQALVKEGKGLPNKTPEQTAEAARKAGNEVRKLQGFLERAVDSVPGPVEYLGYVFLPTSFFAGPAFEYAFYLRGTNGEVFPAGKEEWGARVRAALWKLLQGLVFLGLTAYAMASGIGPDGLTAPSVTAGASVMAFLLRVRADWFVLLFARFKYYFAWLVAEGSTNLAGFGYVPERASVDPKTKASTVVPANWDGIRNIDVAGFELAGDLTAGTKAWNVGTSNWLNYYVNLRVPKEHALVAVYSLSAFWHGFYPGYYLTFLSVPLFQNLEKEIKAKVSPRLFPSGNDGSLAYTAYNALSVVGTSIALNYIVCPFQALSWDASMVVWQSLYFSGHAVALAGLVLLSFVRAPRKAAPAAKKAQ